jgi:hypothetical protein
MLQVACANIAFLISSSSNFSALVDNSTIILFDFSFYFTYFVMLIYYDTSLMEWIPNSNTSECWCVIVIKIARNIHVLFFIHSNKFNQKKKGRKI